MQKKEFHVVLIKPSHYDDQGYVIQWAQSLMPSNSLAVLYALTMECAENKTLGEDIEFKVSAFDEFNTRIKPKKIIRQFKAANARGLIGLVGVQSNQYPRAIDLARQFRSAGVPVCIGGFHVSGCLAMLPDITADLQEAVDMGVSLFAGEAEGRMAQVLADAYSGKMQPIYNWMHELPDLDNVPMPYLPKDCMGRYALKETTFDAGRGCPYLCSFCTIINVQGRKSRSRNVGDIEKLVRKNYARGIRHYFITDDNFARNRDWEPILDCLIKLREEEGIPLSLILQVDTMCHKLPGFIEKSARAGATKIFIGIENLNPDALISARKKQNRIEEYRDMLQQWRNAGVVTYAGIILGFPTDTPDSILRDIKTIQQELPIDIIEFNNLTPLPGSADHKRLYLDGTWMDPDMNNYDLNHITTEHPKMTQHEWKKVYREAWKSYYSLDHIKTLMYRARATNLSIRRIFHMSFHYAGSYLVEGVHAPESGFFRRKYRRDRRPTFAKENPLVFYPRYIGGTISNYSRLAWFFWQCNKLAKEVKRDPNGDNYTDNAIDPFNNDSINRYEESKKALAG